MTFTRSARGSWTAEPACVPAARRLVRDHLRDSDQGDLVDNAELLVSELVSNVVLHVGGTVEVRAHSTSGALLLEVSDNSAVTPQLRAFSATSGTGRGMRLVNSLSAEHGVRLRDGGKTVWARLTSVTSARGDDVLAAHFAGVDWVAELDDTSDLVGQGLASTRRPAPVGHRGLPAPAVRRSAQVAA